MTPDERRDAQVRVLEALGEHLSLQMADLAIGQQEAAKRQEEAIKHRQEFAERMKGIEDTVAATQAITHEVRDLLDAFRGGFKVLGWLGMGLKWLGGIATACVAVYTIGYMLTHGGQLPHGPKQ